MSRGSAITSLPPPFLEAQSQSPTFPLDNLPHLWCAPHHPVAVQGRERLELPLHPLLHFIAPARFFVSGPHALACNEKQGG
jgi:hypothetical protein